MENQHKQIKGYRDLSQEEINLMNKIKALAEQVGELVDETKEQCQWLNQTDVSLVDYQDYADASEWVLSAKEDLQVGFMKLIRAVAKPQSF